MDGALDDLLRHPSLWRAGQHIRDRIRDGDPSPGIAAIPSGFASLDTRLPGGGWPLGAMTEMLYREPGMGEMSLLLPALASLSQRGRWLVWVAPPYRVAVPVLQSRGVDPERVLVVRRCSPAQAWWAAEQALRSSACGAVLLWLRDRGRQRGQGFRELRRLQLAAEAGGGLGVVFRDARWSGESSPAALRLSLVPSDAGLRVELLKSRGGRRVTVCVDTGAVAGPPPVTP